MTERLSVDAQVTNWSWDGETPTLLDVGTPFMWDAGGDLTFDLTPILRMLPAPVRGLLAKDLTNLISRWQHPRGVAVDLASNLYREGLDQWVEPALVCLNNRLRPDEPVRVEEAFEIYEDDKKTFPRLKKMQQLQRGWQSTVRRRRYEFFIPESTYV